MGADAMLPALGLSIAILGGKEVDILSVIGYILTIVGYLLMSQGIWATESTWEIGGLGSAATGGALVAAGLAFNKDFLFVCAAPVMMFLVYLGLRLFTMRSDRK